MPVRGFVCNSLADAEALMASLDAALGFPRPPDPGFPWVDYTKPGPGWTLHASYIYEHPSNGRVALHVEGSIETECAHILGDKCEYLGDDWFPKKFKSD